MAGWSSLLAVLACEEGTLTGTDAGPEAANSVNSDDDDESDHAPSADAGKPSAEPEPTAPSADAAAADCIDEYPFDDGYSCEEQAGWGKCDEPWLMGYCQLSCDRCGEPTAEEVPSLAGPRNVFEEYTPKQPLAPTPPMGWNSWNRFGCDIDETLVLETADAMVASGMADVGYEYVNIDDCWHASERDADGDLAADPDRFPNGIAYVADYVHSLGLKLGIYSDRGTHTCGGLPGSYDYEIQDAETFARWGVDYLKYDNCSVPKGREAGAEMEEDYAIMGEALRQSERPIVYSVCAWWFHPWMVDVGHLWRTTTDIKDIWSGDHHSVIRLLNWSGGDTTRYGAFSESDFESGAYSVPGLVEHAGPNAWNDPDMLEVGNGGMTDTEYRSHFSLWALMAAPLLAGNDLRDMSEATLAILTNEEVIAVNQDPLGVQGVPVSQSTTLEVWSKRLDGDDRYAVILFNRTDEEAEITAPWSDVGLAADAALVRDLWAHDDLGVVAEEYTSAVPAHGVVMLDVTGQ